MLFCKVILWNMTITGPRFSQLLSNHREHTYTYIPHTCMILCFGVLQKIKSINVKIGTSYLVTLLLVYLFGNFISVIKWRHNFFSNINIENLLENISHFHFGYSLKMYIKKRWQFRVSQGSLNEDVTGNWQTVNQGLFTHPHKGKKKCYEAFGLLQLKHFHDNFLS